MFKYFSGTSGSKEKGPKWSHRIHQYLAFMILGLYSDSYFYIVIFLIVWDGYLMVLVELKIKFYLMIFEMLHHCSKSRRGEDLTAPWWVKWTCGLPFSKSWQPFFIAIYFSTTSWHPCHGAKILCLQLMTENSQITTSLTTPWQASHRVVVTLRTTFVFHFQYHSIPNLHLSIPFHSKSL